MLLIMRTMIFAAPAAVLAAAWGLATASTAAAQPALPDPFLLPDVMSGAEDAQGAYAYDLTLIESPPPATTDARGVGITSNATGVKPLKGLPGSMLGNTGRDDDTADPASRVTVGNVHPLPASIGINISAGPSQVTLEHPTGQPPTNFTDPESTVTDDDDDDSDDSGSAAQPNVDVLAPILPELVGGPPRVG